MNSAKAKSHVVGRVTLIRPSLRAHIQIARIDHWFKNVFVLPGVLVALSLDPHPVMAGLPWRLFVGLLATCLVASSNYVINELMDAPFDRFHPVKSARPVPSGRVHIGLAYAQWLGLMLAGITLGILVSKYFTLSLIVLWIMGCVYNLAPLRSKDLPYLDVLSEAVNNPLRMLAGWFIVTSSAIPPASLLITYWMVGCYFMAMKRFAEFEELGDSHVAASYRRSFGFYTRERLLVSIMFYASAAMLFFGAFIMRYRLELVGSFPLVALVMSIYLSLAFRPNSPVQHPEKLYRQPWLMASVLLCTLVMVLLFFVDVPVLYRIFAPTVPPGAAAGALKYGP
jgi:4-hydroxybenzoate polyprenyltransferase